MPETLNDKMIEAVLPLMVELVRKKQQEMNERLDWFFGGVFGPLKIFFWIIR